jgi:CheY-like chemotaxis protein
MVQRTGGVVVVVEDDVDIRELAVELLASAGFPAVGAANGLEALARGRDRRTPPALFVLDLEMPVMSGWEFLRAQARDPVLAGVPVIVTSSSEPGPIRCDAYLPKPYDPRALLRAIAAAGVAAQAA